MAIALVQSFLYYPAAAGGGTSGAVDTRGSTFHVMGISTYVNAGQVSVSDSAGNTWRPCGKVTNSVSGCSITQYYSDSGLNSATHTFTVTGTGCYPTFTVYSFSGGDPQPLAQTAFLGNSASGTSYAISYTPPIAGVTVFSSCFGTAASAITATNLSGVLSAADAGSNVCHWAGYKIQTSPAAISSTISWTTSDAACVVSGLYRPTISAGGGLLLPQQFTGGFQ